MVVDSSFLGTEHPLCLVRPWYMSECPGLEYCWPPITEAVKWVRSISVSFWKSKTPTEKSSEVNFGKSKWKTKTKNVLLFDQRQNIKSKKTRQESKEVNFIRPRPNVSGYFWNPRNFLPGFKSLRVFPRPNVSLFKSNLPVHTSQSVFTLSSSANLYLAFFVSWENFIAHLLQ